MALINSNALVALAAAASWGGGDFSGGMGVKAAAAGGRDATAGALRLVMVAHGASLLVLVAILLAQRASFGLGAEAWWALSAGLANGVSLTAFYMALSRGEMGVSAAVSGLLAAGIPAVVASFLEGFPSALKLAGFVLALGAIWVIAAGPSAGDKGKTMALAVVGGLGFGYYFVALKLANPLGVLAPMALARLGSFLMAGVLLGLVVRSKHGHPGFESPAPGHPVARAIWWKWALGVAVLDTGGNLLFVWATRLGRLDVAAVLASLYPASTILLAAWRLHERPTRRQVVGMMVALVAVGMITL